MPHCFARSRQSIALPYPSLDKLAVFRCIAAVTAIVIVQFLMTAAAFGTDPIVRIEEDWRVEISAPDIDDEAPQITTVMAPSDTLSSFHAVFELNHMTQPEYMAGGMQLQTWLNRYVRDFRNPSTAILLHHESEVITYTMRMTLISSQLQFEVINGQSQSWGTFGDQGILKSTPLSYSSTLAYYTPQTSVTNSRIGYASHRVRSMILKEVRYYSANGLVSTDVTTRVVHGYDGL